MFARMGNLKPWAQVLLLAAAFVVLLAVGGGVGDVAHLLLSAPAETLPTATVAPSQPPPGTATVAPSAVFSPPPEDTVVYRPTSTPRPTATPLPTPAWGREVVRPGDRGLYDVCRRHCPGLRHDFAALDRYARRVAEANGLSWGANGPALETGMELSMPPCP